MFLAIYKRKRTGSLSLCALDLLETSDSLDFGVQAEASRPLDARRGPSSPFFPFPGGIVR